MTVHYLTRVFEYFNIKSRSVRISSDWTWDIWIENISFVGRMPVSVVVLMRWWVSSSYKISHRASMVFMFDWLNRLIVLSIAIARAFNVAAPI